MRELHIIFTKEEVLISRKPYASWREIQEEHDDYMASLGPWKAAAVASWLAEEYSDLIPSAKEQVEALLSNEQVVRKVSFAE